MVSWTDAPQLAPVADYKLKCEDYIPAGAQGGAQYSDIMVVNFGNPKDADKYLPFRVFLNDQREKPATLDDDVWAGIQERNQQLKEAIFEAFGFDENKDEYFKLIGKDTGKNTLRVIQQTQKSGIVNTIGLPRNPAPQGDYHLEILGGTYKEKEELGLRKWLTLTIGVVGQDEDGNSYTPIRGTDTMVRFCWSKEFKCKATSEDGKGWEDEKAYLGNIMNREVFNTKRICLAFGLPMPEPKEDKENLWLEWPSDPRALFEKGLKTVKSLRLGQRLDETGQAFNTINWPNLPR